MSDMDNVRKHIREAKAEGRIISHGCARTIAGMYHDGGQSISYQFLSTGAIEPGLCSELFPNAMTGDVGHNLMASAMSEYINFWTALSDDNTRGPIDKWDTLWVDKPELELAEQVEEPMPPGTEQPELFTVKVKHGRQWYADSVGETFVVFYDGVSGFRLWSYGRPGRGWIMPEDCVTLDGEGNPMIWHKHEHPGRNTEGLQQVFGNYPKHIAPVTFTVQEMFNAMNDLIVAGRANNPVFIAEMSPSSGGVAHYGPFRAINATEMDVNDKVYLVMRDGDIHFNAEGQINVNS